jgi:hypothetical protein
MDNDFKIWEHQADAYKRLNRALSLGGYFSAGDLLGANTRAHVTRLMTESETARALFGLRQLSTHRLWRALVKRCAETPGALGFMRVEGGLRGLGEELGAESKPQDMGDPSPATGGDGTRAAFSGPGITGTDPDSLTDGMASMDCRSPGSAAQQSTRPSLGHGCC